MLSIMVLGSSSIPFTVVRISLEVHFTMLFDELSTFGLSRNRVHPCTDDPEALRPQKHRAFSKRITYFLGRCSEFSSICYPDKKGYGYFNIYSY
jgi:hypothetical protein